MTTAATQKWTAQQQVPKEHYRGYFFTPIRIENYMHQLLLLQELQPRSVLEIGVGPGFLASVLRRHTDICVVTLDLAADLKPDVVASVDWMPFRDASFDAVVCCQVLEHVPFEKVPGALAEIARVTCKAVVLSLPDVRRHYALEAVLPKTGRRCLPFDLERLRLGAYRFAGEHYWEIGYPGTRFSDLKRVIRESGLRVERHFRLPGNPWHSFFLLRPR